MSFNAKDMTQGGQIASMRIRMFSQIANIMLYCLFIFFWIRIRMFSQIANIMLYCLFIFFWI
ncbi:hypothetical protein, partial [Escherichia coli]|uniref:hypothetical protein n=1 Tax=Escherichia coli TaxID=562 RepID=UPI00197AB83C